MCIDCNDTSIPIGPKGDPGTNGTNGIDGEDGLFGGWSSSWKYKDNQTTTPAVTYLSTNDTDLNDVTEIYINDTNSLSIDLADFVASFYNEGNLGLLRLFKEHDSSKFAYYEITGLSHTGAVTTLSVTYVDGNGAFVLDDSVIATFTPGLKRVFFSAQVTPPEITTSVEANISQGVTVPVTEVYDGWTPGAYDGIIWTVPVTGFYDLNAWLYATVNEANDIAFGDGYVTIGITTTDGQYLFASGTQHTNATTFFLHVTATTNVAYLTAGRELVIKVLNHTTQNINDGGTVVGRAIKWSAELVKEII